MKRALVEAPPSRHERCLRAFDEEFDYLHRVLRRHGVGSDDVEDLVQEVFVVMCRRWGDFQADRPLRPWLAGIAVHLAYRFSARRHREIPDSEIDLPAWVSPVDDRIAARALLAAALAAVPETNRIALVLHDLEGLPMRDVADALAIPLPTAYTRLGRGRRALAEAVRRLDGDAPARTPALAAPALIELGRLEGEAPAPELRRRAVARARATPPPSGSASGGFAPRGSGPPPALGAGTLALLVGLVLFSFRAPTVADRGPAPAVAPSRAPAGPVPGAATTGAALPRPLAVATTAAARQAAATLAHGLTGYWRFDDRPGSAIARDLSGQGNDCTLERAEDPQAWASGTLGGALSFGDNAGWVSCQPAAAAHAALGITVAAWVKPGKFRKFRQAVVSLQRKDDGRSHFLLGVRAHSVVLASEVWKLQLEHPLPQGTRHWVHMAFTHAADGSTRLYVGGVEVGEARAAADDGAPDARLSLGYARDPLTQQTRQKFRGEVDELTIYDRVLAAAEIDVLAAGQQPQP